MLRLIFRKGFVSGHTRSGKYGTIAHVRHYRRADSGPVAATPVLDKLMADGVIKMDLRTKEYWAVDAQGNEIGLGVMGDEAGLERYLSAHPSPADW